MGFSNLIDIFINTRIRFLVGIKRSEEQQLMSIVEIEKLPTAFADLEDLAGEWSLPTERARKEKRATAALSDLQAYYDRLKPRIPAIAEHLDQMEFGLGKLGPSDRALLQLAYLYMETAMAVEFYHRAEPADAFPRDRFVIEDIRI